MSRTCVQGLDWLAVLVYRVWTGEQYLCSGFGLVSSTCVQGLDWLAVLVYRVWTGMQYMCTWFGLVSNTLVQYKAQENKNHAQAKKVWFWF